VSVTGRHRKASTVRDHRESNTRVPSSALQHLSGAPTGEPIEEKCRWLVDRAGLRGCMTGMRRRERTPIELMDAIDAVRAFAGEQIEAAVVHDPATRMLIDFDRDVMHAEVVDDEPRLRDP
jgi:hypothetical protein